MCYGSGDIFDNVEEMSSYEDLQNYLSETGTHDAVESSLTLNPREVHSHGGHRHSHAYGGHDHSHSQTDGAYDRSEGHAGRLTTDGGTTTTLQARNPAFDTSFDRLVENARDVVRTPSVKDQWGRSGNIPGYDIEEGDDVLLVVNSTYDREVVDAFVEAFEREGADTDVLNLHFPEKGEAHPWWEEGPGVTYPEDPIDERFKDLRSAKTPDERAERGYVLERRHLYPDDEDADWWENVAGENDYDLLVYGIGGPTPKDAAERPYRYERIPWRKPQSLAGNSASFPRDVWGLIDEKTAEIVTEAEEMRLTDPEGTDLQWTNYVTDVYPRKRPCHVHGHPLLPTSQLDTSGVIKGTTNHANAFPAIEVEIEQGKVVSVNDGGEYGDLWGETLEVMREYDGMYGDLWEEKYDEWKEGPGADLNYDYYDGSPGMFWLWECAIGTNPKYGRPVGADLTQFEFPLIERLRAGVIHLGMGTIPHEMGLKRKAKEQGLPWGHVHVHLLFPTLEATMPDGRTEKIIDDGYLTTLDHPEVREKAAEHGDPDEILDIDWVADMPGISSDGEYEEYAADPKAWLREKTVQSG